VQENLFMHAVSYRKFQTALFPNNTSLNAIAFQCNVIFLDFTSRYNAYVDDSIDLIRLENSRIFGHLFISRIIYLIGKKDTNIDKLQNKN